MFRDEDPLITTTSQIISANFMRSAKFHPNDNNVCTAEMKSFEGTRDVHGAVLTHNCYSCAYKCMLRQVEVGEKTRRAKGGYSVSLLACGLGDLNVQVLSYMAQLQCVREREYTQDSVRALFDKRGTCSSYTNQYNL